MASAVRQWANPRWNAYRGKHRPRNGTPWKRVLEGTKHDPAKYHPDVTLHDQEALEMGCVANGTFIKEVGSVRLFYQDAGYTIGASLGIETSYVYAEYNAMGDVHGSPITVAELKRLGVQL